MVRYRIADLVIEVRGEVDDLAPIYARFGSEDEPGLVIEIERVAGGSERPEDPVYPAFRRELVGGGRVRVERYDAVGEIETEAWPVRARFRVGPSRHSLEACVRVATSLALPRAGGLLLHASAVEADGRGLVFSGASGVGKSTISAMLDGAGARKIGDELLVLHEGDGGWQVVVPPYLAKEPIAHGAAAPLASIDLLAQAPVHRRTRLAAGEALRAVLPNVLVYVAEAATADRVLSLTSALVAAVPVHRLEFRKDPDVAQVLGIRYPRGAA